MPARGAICHVGVRVDHGGIIE